jgi:hypothetical protein
LIGRFYHRINILSIGLALLTSHHPKEVTEFSNSEVTLKPLLRHVDLPETQTKLADFGVGTKKH